MHDQHILDLLEKFHEGRISPEEMDELNNWYSSLDQEKGGELFDPATPAASALTRQRLLELKGRLAGDVTIMFPTRRIVFLRRMSRIAVILAGICLGSYFLIFAPKKRKDPVAITQTGSHFKNDVAPGTRTAVLTLADGSTISLDSATNGTLALQSNSRLVKKPDGQLQYSASNSGNGVMAYNTLFVPKGSKAVQLTLSDGTRVWINAFSTLRYPVVFSEIERKVEVTGEAYFEVAKNEQNPFIVQRGQIRVQVLGTQFNVNSYDDESNTKITLLEGSVKIHAVNASTSLSPGEQASVQAEGKIIINKDVDLDEVMAWKNGRFAFNGSTIDLIMRQIERWYNVEVEYEGSQPEDHFMGDISRMENVSEVLKMLEQTEAVRFSIEGKKIIVRRK